MPAALAAGDGQQAGPPATDRSWVRPTGRDEGRVEGRVMGTASDTSPAPAAAVTQRNEWRLSTAEVHARQSLSGFALSPDGQQIALLLRRDRRSEADRNRKRIKDTPLADICLLPGAGG